MNKNKEALNRLENFASKKNDPYLESDLREQARAMVWDPYAGMSIAANPNEEDRRFLMRAKKASTKKSLFHGLGGGALGATAGATAGYILGSIAGGDSYAGRAGAGIGAYLGGMTGLVGGAWHGGLKGADAAAREEYKRRTGKTANYSEDQLALNRLENFASPKTSEGIKNHMINEKRLRGISDAKLTPEELKSIYNAAIYRTMEDRLKSIESKYTNTIQNTPKRYYQLTKAANNSYDVLKSAEPIALETVKPSKSILSKLVRLVKFSEDQSALNRLSQFAEKKEEDKPISYYIKNGAKWGGVGGLATGIIKGAHDANEYGRFGPAYKKVVMNDPNFTPDEKRNLLDNGMTTYGKNGNKYIENRDYYILNDDKIESARNNAYLEQAKVGFAKLPVTVVIGSGIGAAAGAAYGAGKKIYKLVKKD